MDITSVFETVVPGSNPGGSTIERSDNKLPQHHTKVWCVRIRIEKWYTRRVKRGLVVFPESTKQYFYKGNPIIKTYVWWTNPGEHLLKYEIKYQLGDRILVYKHKNSSKSSLLSPISQETEIAETRESVTAWALSIPLKTLLIFW